MSLILQIETATTACSVALADNGVVLAQKSLNQRNVHAEVITLFIEQVFAEAGKQYQELAAVAVSCGPGSYTGLRIGVSTAKGMCYALDKPLIAIETLQAMANGMFLKMKGDSYNNQTLLCPMIDARRMEVFTAVFDTKGNKVMPTAALIIDENSFADLLKDHEIYFFGDGAEKCREAINHPNAYFSNYVNDAADITEIALSKLNNKDFEDVAYFEPYYLKDFIAGVKKA